MNEVLAAAEGLTVEFGGTPVLRDVDFELRAGEVHAITGENGAGKSTLAKTIAGVNQPTRGRISPTAFSSPAAALQSGVALVHQEPLTFPDLTVAENIFVGFHPTGRAGSVAWKDIHAKATEVLRSIGSRLDPKRLVRGLPVADQQMIELASALVHHAKVILLDETTASLTPKEVEELFVVVRRLREQGCAIGFVSHKLEEVFAICDRITVLRDGSKVASWPASETSVREVIRAMVGRDVTTSHAEGHAGGDIVFSARDLRLQDGAPTVSFELKKGQILGVAGLVGAGRTEIAEAIYGARPLVSGAMTLDGKPYRVVAPDDALYAGLVLVPEDRQHAGLLLPMSISRNATLPILRRLARVFTSEHRENTPAADWIDRLRVVCRGPMQPVGELSGGNQQKVVFAKANLCAPKVLIVDEPTRGVDVGAKAEIHQCLRDLAAAGVAVMAISSDLPEALSISDRLIVMRQGAIVAEFTAGADQEAVMRAATGQVDA